MLSLTKTRLLGSAILSRIGHINGVATAGAILICMSAVLNLAPFATSPDRPGAVGGQPAVMTEPSVSTFVEQHRVPQEIAASVQPAALVLAEAARPAPPALADAAVKSDPVQASNVDKSAIEGVWAPEAAACSANVFRDGALPTIINSEGAWAGETFCIFTKRTETEKGWKIVAKCSSLRESWTSHIRLTVNDNRLIWTSQRGTQTYSRCRPELLLAQAR
ncbi:MAG TPA: hypothetical protein VGH49_07885 [Xanthobacteraceae bacterium]